MKILIISVVFPYPIDAGGSAGTHKLIDYLRKHHEITLITPHASEEHVIQLQAIWPDVRLITPSDPLPETRPSFPRRLYDFFKPKAEISFEEKYKQNMILFSTDFVNCYFGDIVQLVKKELQENTFDLIQVEYIEFAPFVYILPESTPKIFIHHELRYKRAELEYKTLNYTSDEIEWRLNTNKELEIALLNRYDKVITVSDKDAEYLAEDGLISEKLAVSPSPVEMSRHTINTPFVFKNRIIYLGPEKHYPNLDAVEWFLKNCWAEISEHNPQLEFHIVGKWSEEFRFRYKDLKNVKFAGFVEDLNTIMDGAIMIVPLRIVSGMRMKILEAVSWNVPVISTAAGAEGLPMVHNENCLIADSERAFITAVNHLVNSPDLQEELVRNSGKMIINSYSRESCGQIRDKHYYSILKTDRN